MEPRRPVARAGHQLRAAPPPVGTRRRRHPRQPRRPTPPRRTHPRQPPPDRAPATDGRPPLNQVPTHQPRPPARGRTPWPADPVRLGTAPVAVARAPGRHNPRARTRIGSRPIALLWSGWAWNGGALAWDELVGVGDPAAGAIVHRAVTAMLTAVDDTRA